jgi:TolB-like protein
MHRLAFGPFVFEPARGVLLRDGRPVRINQKGIRILVALLGTPGQPVAKTALMDAAWAGTAVEESNLSVQIAALRKLLGAAQDGGEWIATVPRVGYRFAGTLLSAEAATQDADTAVARPLIAVLPFGIVSGETGKEYLADGITDDIITALARYRWFRVVVRGSAFALGDDQLGARYALHGNVRHSGERLRISAQLIDTREGAHLWAERYDVAMADVFAIQDEIAERVVAAIEPELLRSESRLAVTRHTGNITAWDLVRQGMWHFHKVTREGHRAARELFRRACTADPDLSEAHSWLGRVSAGIIAYGWSDDAAADGCEGAQAATRAVALDPRDPYAHYSFAIVSCYAGSANTGALAAQSAIDLNPSFALGHLVLGMARLFDGHAKRAVVPLRYGLTLNPNDPQNVAWHILLAYAELLSDAPDKAIECANRALVLRPMFGPTFEVLCCCAMALGRRDHARGWAERMQGVDEPEGHFIAPIRASRPEYDERITQWLQAATA